MSRLPRSVVTLYYLCTIIEMVKPIIITSMIAKAIALSQSSVSESSDWKAET